MVEDEEGVSSGHEALEGAKEGFLVILLCIAVRCFLRKIEIKQTRTPLYKITELPAFSRALDGWT